jgi:uncharacterized protein (DUF433 family)
MLKAVSYDLVGIGLYTPSEAQRLTGIPATKLVRWLRGHTVGDHPYERLWPPQIELHDNRTYLGFRDLMEARVAAGFIDAGLSPQKVRQAIEIARNIVKDDRPLSTARLRTDGMTVFLQRVDETGDESLIDLFRKQYAFKRIVEPSLRNLDFEEGVPARWWPASKSVGIVVDPTRSFGQPVDDATGIPTRILSEAAISEGSVEGAAMVWRVPTASLRRAVSFEQELARAA